MDKRFLSILAVLVIIFGGIFLSSQHKNSSSSGSSGGGGQPTNNVEGQNSKGVTFEEYGDYECPVCGEYAPLIAQALTPDLLQQIHFQFRNLPLTQIHQNAFAAARAAQTAGYQGKYWQMHNLLYQNQNDWTSSKNPQSIFQNYAKQLGLNMTQFNNDYASGKADNAINADVAEFKKTGQQEATPTFFLDGQYVDNSKFTDSSTGTPSAAAITKVIQDEIAKKNPAKK